MNTTTNAALTKAQIALLGDLARRAGLIFVGGGWDRPAAMLLARRYVARTALECRDVEGLSVATRVRFAKRAKIASDLLAKLDGGATVSAAMFK
jgi:hypothetical protein